MGYSTLVVILETAMSASACIAYFGLRYDVAAEEIEGLELRSDERQLAARRFGLSTYWGNFGGLSDRYLLLVGTKIAVLGPEDEPRATRTLEQLAKIMSDTIESLRSAGLDGEPSLYLEWLEDV